VLGYNDEVGCFTMRSIVCLSYASRALPRRLIKVPSVGNTMVPERIQLGVLDYVLCVYYKATRHGLVSGSAMSSCIQYPPRATVHCGVRGAGRRIRGLGKRVISRHPSLALCGHLETVPEHSATIKMPERK
jgi:hypothetical protein